MYVIVQRKTFFDFVSTYRCLNISRFQCIIYLTILYNCLLRKKYFSFGKYNLKLDKE